MTSLRQILFGGVLFFSVPLFSQNQTEDERIMSHTPHIVAQLNDYISFMASKKKPTEDRKRRKTNALNLFLGNGFSYEENGVEKEGVMMETTSVNRSTVNTLLIRDYFDRLIRLRYSDVEIKSTEIADIKVSNLQQIDENLYVCTCQYDQAFVGYRDGKLIFKNIETKRIKCFISSEDTEDGKEFIVKCGDMTALETRRL